MKFQLAQDALKYIRSITDFQPTTGIILGTGLGNLTDTIDVIASIPYKDIPHFPVSTVESHKGKLIFGYLSGKAIVAMAGRFHYYEGYSMQQIVFPVRVMKMLGIKKIFISNVSGSTNKNMLPGDIVFVKDHINLMGANPLRGQNDENLGPRFPDMLETYNKALIQQGMGIAKANNIRCHQGVYVALQGPSLETPAEYNFLHIIGGDLVGMSTVPEVIASVHLGLEILVLSVVSNLCYPIESISITTLEAVIKVAVEAEPKMTLIVKKLLAQQEAEV